MAAFVQQRSGSRISYNGGSIGEQQLPTGSCDFRDLSIGARAPTCGCKRFWLNNSNYNGQDTWCFCGHHACFHNASSQQQQQSVDPASLGAVRSGYTGGGDNVAVAVRQDEESSGSVSKPAGLGIRPPSSAQDQSINTRLWAALNAFAREQEDGPVSDTTSKLPSTACPSIVGDVRLSPSRVLQQRAQQQFRSMGPPINIPSNYPPAPGTEEYSATEVATPSANGTPDLRAFGAPGSQARASPGGIPSLRAAATSSPAILVRPTTEVAHPCATGQSTQHFTPPSVNSTLSPSEMTTLLRAFGRRVDVLESLSFSHVPVEEVQDKFELIDGRLLDLEQWRADQPQDDTTPEPAKPSSSKRRRLLPSENNSFESEVSFDSAAAAHTEAVVLATLAATAETGPRIDALENRVADLESAALPSFARPWQVQVVLVPWSRELRGIWFSALEATQQSIRSSQQISDEWSGAQSAPNLSFKSTANGAWTTESIQAWADEAHEWLSPKACGPGGMAFQRLESRGLVRDITLTAPDSRHILSALADAFGKILTSSGDPRPEGSSHYQALREPFVPLRKVRKSTRLRFLSPAEMVSSATWTASFLDSSLLMNVNDGQRRLYITTPEAYLQPNEQRWSWQTIRQLPMFDATGEEQAAQATHAVIEACWTYNERLDQPTSMHSSFASHASHDSEWSMGSQQSLHGEAENPDQPMSPRSEARPKRQRTVSLPSSSSAAEQAKASLPKRRVASFETGTTMPLSEGQVALLATAKRRRISNSPEAERRGVGFTPRWSREPPSPFTSEHAGEARSQGAVSRRRGTTPFAYATPHSNSNYIDRMEFLGGDGDTEPDTDMAAPQSELGEDEWHGVEDEGVDPNEHQTNSSQSVMGADVDSEEQQTDDQSAIDDAEIAGNLDEGSMIYEG
ncbi:hypothetical protein LTR36_009296 [Oleoguttula mirabilis]|uniref:Uncharacterized protein n=1 Tax=Oleoguttula mirabilis TaxID=1507867 RepID=A0AAV9J6R2_9PEZI|nr:hypothetical protein LTR36_009296 [Oleoguttula mirabilis]